MKGPRMNYDRTNIFAKIVRGEVPATRIYENEFAIAFADIAPSAPVHVLVIPTGEYRNYSDFLARAGEAEIAGFFRAVRTVAHQLGVGDAFRLITNNGEAAGQSVHHFHVHILAGRPMQKLLAD